MDLLGRARSFFKAVAAAPETQTQYYSVLCPLGHRVRGQRTEGYQAIRCPVCSEGVFVLPTSRLPQPPSPPRSPSRSRSASENPFVDERPIELKDHVQVTVDLEGPDDLGSDAEIIWEDEAPAEPARGAVAKEKRPEPAGEEAARDEARGRSQSPSASKPAAPRTDRAEVDQPGRKRKTTERSRQAATSQQQVQPAARATAAGPSRPASPSPKRQILVANRTNQKPFLILGAVAVLIVCTVLFRSWRSRRGELPQVALVGRTEGIPALKAGRFDHAYQLLSAAKDAVNALGGAVEDADEIRHAADEASIYVDLLSDPLESLLEEAARSSPQSWAERFDKLYQGRSVIIDGNITATPETNPNKRYAIDYLVVPPGEGQVDSRRGRIDLTSLEFVATVQPKVGDRLIFGARLADFKYDSAAGEFVISFDPKSGISMQYYEALQAQGWPSGAIILDDFPSESRGSER